MNGINSKILKVIEIIVATQYFQLSQEIGELLIFEIF